MLRNDRAGRRALALLQLGAATAAERELFAGSIDADPQYIETRHGARPEGVVARRCRRGIGNANWDQRHNIKGYDGGDLSACRTGSRQAAIAIDRALVWGFMRQEFGVQSQGALLCRRHGPDAAHAGHRAARDHAYRRTGPAPNPYDPSTNIALGQAYIARC